jgi:hypothetical protein
LAAPELLDQELRGVLAVIAAAPTLGAPRAMRSSSACTVFFSAEPATTCTTAWTWLPLRGCF